MTKATQHLAAPFTYNSHCGIKLEDSNSLPLNRILVPSSSSAVEHAPNAVKQELPDQPQHRSAKVTKRNLTGGNDESYLLPIRNSASTCPVGVTQCLARGTSSCQLR